VTVSHCDWLRLAFVADASAYAAAGKTRAHEGSFQKLAFQ
jgi:hypothetical protein